MRQKLKKNIYIPIEIKQREYLSNLLIAISVAEKGFKTYIGTKAQIFDLILNKKEKGGIFLYKGGLEPKIFKKISKKVNYNFILDHEITPGQNLSVYNDEVSGNFYEETLKYIDGYFCVNKKVYQIAKKTLGKKIRGKIYLTGWPRNDLFKLKYKNIYTQKAREIKKKLNDFILFSSDFAYISDYRDNTAKEFIHFGSSKDFIRKKKILLEISNFNFNDFIRTVKFFNAISKKIKKKIVVRAHPADNIDVWKEKLNKNPNIVFKEPNDDIHPWILASNGYIHRGCTTSMQAFYLKKKIGYLNLYKKNKHLRKFVYDFSEKIYDENSFFKWLQKKNNLKKFKYRNVKKELYIKNQDSADKITKIFEKFKVTKESIKLNSNNLKFKIYFYNFFLKYFFLIKKIILHLLIKSKLIERNLDRLFITPKTEGGFNSIEAKRYIRFLKKNKTYKIKDIAPDLISIESKF